MLHMHEYFEGYLLYTDGELLWMKLSYVCSQIKAEIMDKVRKS